MYELKAWEETYCNILSSSSPFLLVTTTRGNLGPGTAKQKQNCYHCVRAAADLGVGDQIPSVYELASVAVPPSLGCLACEGGSVSS